MGYLGCNGWLLGVFYSDLGVCYGVFMVCCVVVPRVFLECYWCLLGGFCGVLGGC